MKAKNAFGELTGAARDRVIREFMQWYEQYPDPWQRAQAGLVMAIPHDPSTSVWP